MAQDGVFSTAAYILQNEGELAPESPLALQSAYADDRIELVASISPASGQIIALFINLNLPFEGEYVSGVTGSDTPFALPRPLTFETPVYQWAGGEVSLHRPGLWETYLQHLARGIEARVQALNMLNGVPVDDSGLFGDVPLITTR